MFLTSTTPNARFQCFVLSTLPFSIVYIQLSACLRHMHASGLQRQEGVSATRNQPPPRLPALGTVHLLQTSAGVARSPAELLLSTAHREPTRDGRLDAWSTKQMSMPNTTDNCLSKRAKSPGNTTKLVLRIGAGQEGSQLPGNLPQISRSGPWPPAPVQVQKVEACW